MTIKRILGIAIAGLAISILIGFITISIAKANPRFAQLPVRELTQVAHNDLDGGLSPLTNHLLSRTVERRNLPVSRGLGQHVRVLTSLHGLAADDLLRDELDLLGLS